MDPERFAFAGRVRRECPNAMLVLLLHEPSRERVIAGLQLQADAMLGWPRPTENLVAKIVDVLHTRLPQST